MTCKDCIHQTACLDWCKGFEQEAELCKHFQSITHGKMNMYMPRSTNRNATYKCFVCGKLCSSYYNDIGEWKFCPHCGACIEDE